MSEHVRLTATERCVIVELRAGRSIQEIARACGRAESTVRWHVKNLHRKVGATNQVELLLWALKHAACCVDRA